MSGRELSRKKHAYKNDPDMYVFYQSVDRQHMFSFLEMCKLFVTAEFPETQTPEDENKNPFKVALKVSFTFQPNVIIF